MTLGASEMPLHPLEGCLRDRHRPQGTPYLAAPSGGPL